MQLLMRRMGRSVSACGLALLLLTTSRVGSADAAAGQELFETNCAVCHGSDGTPVLPNAPHFEKGERLEKTDTELLTSLSEGLNVMPPWKGVLSDEEMREILAYVRSFAQ